MNTAFIKKLIALLFLGITFNCCAQSAFDPVYSPQRILSSSTNWRNYLTHLRLWKEFVGYDTNGKLLSKEVFLKKLTTKSYMPLWLKTKDTDNVRYQLYKIDTSARKIVKVTFEDQIADVYYQYKMEGNPYPSFRFVDAKRHVYTNTSTSGKIIVFNYFFRGCLACNIERPALNKLAAQYKDRKDILFIALDNDQEYNNKMFLAESSFLYNVVRVDNDFMTKILNVYKYPQNVIVGRNGKILKAFNNDPNGLSIALKYYASKSPTSD